VSASKFRLQVVLVPSEYSNRNFTESAAVFCNNCKKFQNLSIFKDFSNTLWYVGQWQTVAFT